MRAHCPGKPGQIRVPRDPSVGLRGIRLALLPNRLFSRLLPLLDCFKHLIGWYGFPILLSACHLPARLLVLFKHAGCLLRHTNQHKQSVRPGLSQDECDSTLSLWLARTTPLQLLPGHASHRQPASNDHGRPLPIRWKWIKLVSQWYPVSDWTR